MGDFTLSMFFIAIFVSFVSLPSLSFVLNSSSLLVKFLHSFASHVLKPSKEDFLLLPLSLLLLVVILVLAFPDHRSAFWEFSVVLATGDGETSFLSGFVSVFVSGSWPVYLLTMSVLLLNSDDDGDESLLLLLLTSCNRLLLFLLVESSSFVDVDSVVVDFESFLSRCCRKEADELDSSCDFDVFLDINDILVFSSDCNLLLVLVDGDVDSFVTSRAGRSKSFSSWDCSCAIPVDVLWNGDIFFLGATGGGGLFAPEGIDFSTDAFLDAFPTLFISLCSFVFRFAIAGIVFSFETVFFTDVVIISELTDANVVVVADFEAAIVAVVMIAFVVVAVVVVVAVGFVVFILETVSFVSSCDHGVVLLPSTLRNRRLPRKIPFRDNGSLSFLFELLFLSFVTAGGTLESTVSSLELNLRLYREGVLAFSSFCFSFSVARFSHFCLLFNRLPCPRELVDSLRCLRELLWEISLPVVVATLTRLDLPGVFTAPYLLFVLLRLLLLVLSGTLLVDADPL